MTELIEVNVSAGTTVRQASFLEPSVLAAVKAYMVKGTLFLEARGKIECPVKTGFMRNSHTSEIGFPVSRVRVLASYGPHVHNGTRHQRANPWMSRARNQTVQFLNKEPIQLKLMK